jgi:cyclic pyranopterin phosphate synthase
MVEMGDARLTHLDAEGRAHMVDVSAKEPTLRRAVAEGLVHMAPATLDLVTSGAVAKGDALAVARLAGIQGAKRTADLVPLCHPVRLDHVAVDLEPLPPGGVRIRAEAVAFDRTGVEMEALTAVAAAALALYDMIKGVDRSAEIATVRLLSKEGGRSGPWSRPPEE